MSRAIRTALVLAGALCALALLVAIGRWEGVRHARVENRGIERIVRLVGPLDSPSLDAYRTLTAFDCLLYRRDSNDYSLELCIDPRGRVIEAIDRRGATPRISSLREDPPAATLHVDRGEVDRLIHRLQNTG
jgi:hypothetical protein